RPGRSPRRRGDRRPLTRMGFPSLAPRSVSVGADDLTLGAAPERPPGGPADRVLDELHAAVGEKGVHSTVVVARRGKGDAAVVALAGVALRTAEVERVLVVVGRLAHIEEAAFRGGRPAIAAVAGDLRRCRFVPLGEAGIQTVQEVLRVGRVAREVIDILI